MSLTKDTPDVTAKRSGKLHRRGVAKLAHVLCPTADEFIVVRQPLQAGGFAHREISDAAVRESNHVFPAGHTVHSCFERLGWLVNRAARVARICSRAQL